jgi:putative ABC transport system permease protein
MLRTTLASLRFRAMRLAMSSLAIAAGVAFVAGTLILGASLKQSFFNSFAAGARNVAAAVTPHGSDTAPTGSPSAPSLPTSALQAVRAVSGVASAQGRVIGQAALIGSDGKVVGGAGQVGIGINVATDPSLRGFTVVHGRLPSTPAEVAIDSSTAADEHYRLGQVVKIVGRSGTIQRFRLTGTISLGVNHAYGNDSVAAFQTATALRVTGRPGFDQIVTRAAPGVSQSALVARLKAVPALTRDHVQTGSRLASSEASAGSQVTQQFTEAILVFALISLVVASIVIFNTFQILGAQRRRELALLRCVGASKRQVFGGMLTEAAVVGVAASAVGVLAGLGLGYALQYLFSALGVQIPTGSLVLGWSTVAIAMVTGVVVTVLAAMLPARAATRVPPVAALGGPEPRVTRQVGWVRIGTAVALGAAGLGLAFLGMQKVNGTGGFVEILAGGAAFFVAVLVLGPLIAPPVTTVLGWLPGRLAGVPARLASANARRNPHRVAATTAALTIGATLMTLFTVVLSSAQASSTETINKDYPFGYFVTAGSGNGSQAVPYAVISRLRRSPALGLVATFYYQQRRVDGSSEAVGAVDSAALKGSGELAVTGSLSAIRPGTAAVDTKKLKTLHTRRGGTVVVSTPGGPLRLTVVATFRTANGLLPNVLTSVPDYLRAYHPEGAQEVFINGRGGTTNASARTAVDTATAADPLLSVATVADYRSQLSGEVNKLIGIVIALLGLAILIALLGIANTLSLSVLERTRESALLRALGLTRGQLRGMLLTEALLMALLGVALGVSLGTGFAWAIVDAFVKSAGTGVVSFPGGQIALYAAIGAVAGVAAAILPAQRAARASVVAAMAET